MTATATPLEPTGIVTLGETMGLVAQRLPGPLPHSRDFRIGIGGAESNVAIGACRLGASATWIGRVGRDEIGELILRELRAESVRPLVTFDDAPTGMMVKLRRTPTASTVRYYRAGSAGSHLHPGDLDTDAIAAATVLHVTGITAALGDSPAATIHAAIDIARAAHTTVSLDVNYRSALWGRDDASRALRDIARRCDIVFAGDDEATLLTAPADRPADLAAGIADLGPREVIIKLGARGAVAAVDGTIHTRRAVTVDVVDTVGAGDAFVAGYLAELVAGRDVTDRLDTAVTAGAFAVTGTGDWESMPTRAELALLTAADPVHR